MRKRLKEGFTIFIIVYFIFSYIELEINPSLWSNEARLSQILVSFVIFYVYQIFKDIIGED